MNAIKTVLLLGLLSGLLVVGGGALGGRQGLILGLGMAVVMNAFSYFYSDKLALRMYRAQPVSPTENPEVGTGATRVCCTLAGPMSATPGRVKMYEVKHRDKFGRDAICRRSTVPDCWVRSVSTRTGSSSTSRFALTMLTCNWISRTAICPPVRTSRRRTCDRNPRASIRNSYVPGWRSGNR